MRLIHALRGLLVAFVIGTVACTHPTSPATPTGATLFNADGLVCVIVVPARPIAAELRAAEMVRDTLAKASGKSASAFVIQREGWLMRARSGIFVGATRQGYDFMAKRASPPYDTAVGVRVRDGGVVIRSERRGSIETAASWFLEKYVGAYWFMPGPLGEHIPRFSSLELARTEETFQPGFVSRDLSLGKAPTEEWSARNRLESRFEHGHNLGTIFRPEDFVRRPEMAAGRGGEKYLPRTGEMDWQPDFSSAAAVKHAADKARQAFAASPDRMTFSLGLNDSLQFDDSEATRAAVSPARFFRRRPNYSDLVFRFTNQVAEQVAKKYPDRWLTAYAYYWCEDTPRFPVASNVVPFLTADRSRWADPEFAAEDRALIDRWCRSGAGIVGLYDYYYGAPYLCPRPTLYAVMESIPFAHQAGVRAFYAETLPNWALDGPKQWLAAQLLWAPHASATELLATYYREYWREVAEPMRAFFETCERVWKGQPGPPVWLRYFKDDDQIRIFSPGHRAELRGCLDRAIGLARTDLTRARLAFLGAGFGVVESFWKFGDAREHCGQLAATGAAPALLMDAWKLYRAARSDFVQAYQRVRCEFPSALATQDLEIYLRHEPDSRAAWELTRTDVGRGLLRDSAPWSSQYLGATGEEIAAVLSTGAERLEDAGWTRTVLLPVSDASNLDWTTADSEWQGSGEPWEGRTVAWVEENDGERVLRMAGCRTEGIGQWTAANPGQLFAARVNVRAKSSPGTATFLIISFADEQHRHIGIGRVDRLPANAAPQDATLCVIARAPAQAHFVGFGVRVLNQVDGDFAEFSRASLRRLEAVNVD